MKTLTIIANDDVVHECTKEKHLEEQQLAYLDKMDQDMSRGIKIQGKFIAHPDSRQKATFVTMNLVRALQQDNEAIISVSCAYLASRMPALSEVHITSHQGPVTIEFIDEH